MNSHLALIDMALSLLRLLARNKVDFMQIKQMHDQAEANGVEVTREQRQALANEARSKIDWLLP